ncbi:shikimate dehydrogenase [Litchfieldia alkalitelluris]|uniref:shikimate dehydrogenase n=1 Tax=Litchfieldia alkalitelluris TaxID=304268 RepID=UPI0009989DAC|nr:shikimate dehydrogenase [Litchfieldia alkalitelluris]
MEKVYGVIGCPIAHSMSPEMHNDLFDFYQLQSRYHAFHIEPEKLSDAIKGFKAIGVSGFNVTVPHKIAILDLLDEVEAVALNIGAVNTVVNEEGRLVGYNTDGQGYIHSIKQKMNQSLEQSRVLLIGAGGAARAIYITLASIGVLNVDIVNRTKEKAVELIGSCQYKNSSTALTIKEVEQALGQYDLIINTTSIGMHPHVEESPISLENLSENTVVSDIIYNPLKTKLLKDAEQKGATIDNGIGMFVNQGALAFEKWTGIFPDTTRMETVVKKKLGG